ncbi:MAG: fumarate hydratase [Kiritimatiellia bacterium]|jgi:fumarate hydratase class I|nr:fumarate hydratase [Kiritimatiellia bacterium]MDP6630737.1 fumarate hydratase [Kiritimatiellia bacterium]MDP6809400.1 fumarate hydratase [Kiritimatiellia bacterium]MDP7023923.1 fumarate hydratase [Kiritimatiellia bacterium]
MKKAHWEKNLVELIRRTSTDLPADVEQSIRKGLRREKKGTSAHDFLTMMLENAAMARRDSVPLCQDTGTLTFRFTVPTGFDTNGLASLTRNAVSKATRLGVLRQNTIDSVSGESYVTNVAHAAPVMEFLQGARKTVDARLIMKGGGCENVGRQYSLPESSLDARRDLEGVRRCVLDAVWQAQGRGCSPGVLGVCIGGDRAKGYAHAKEQFLRKVGERSDVKVLARLEERLMRDIRRMEIGPMGLGGKSTALDVKIGALSRLPASFFVSISYMCWAFRRRGVLLGPEGGVHRWLY